MSGGAYDPNTATVVINGVTLPVPRVIFRNDPYTEALVEARASGAPHADPSLTPALLRMLLGGAVGASGRFYPDGSRGCFHDGCDAAEGEEGGSHWCRWAT